MTNDSSKKPLYHIVDEEAKAGQCRIIEDALKNVGGEIEVAETVIKNQLNTTDSGEKRQLYSLVVQGNQEKEITVKDLVKAIYDEKNVKKSIISKSELNSMKNLAQNIDFEKKTNFEIILNGVYYLFDDSSQSVTRQFLDITFRVQNMHGKNDRNFPRITFDEATNPKIVEKILDAKHYCKSRGELAGYLFNTVNALLQQFSGQSIVIYSRPGWKLYLHDYITSDGAIAHPEQPVRADGKLHISDKYPGSIYPEYCQMLATINETRKMQAILSYVLASFLHSVFEDAGFPVKHALFIVGPRGSKKTSVAQCFTQLGDDRRTVRFNFTATESGLQYNFQHYADQVMLIDDLAPSSDYTDRKRKEKMLESILRLCGDSGERVINTAFMKTGAEQIDYKVRGGIVITGEYLYGTGSESSIARAVVVKLKEESVENTLLSHFQNRDDIFESFIFRFLKFVGLNYDSTIALIRNTMQYYRNNASVYHFSNARYTDYLAQYMTISHILLGMFLYEGNQIIEKDFIDDFHKNICFLLQENDREMRLQAPIDILLSAIVQEINSGSVAQWGAPFTKEINFIRGEGAIYFRQMDLPKIVTDYTQKNNFPNPSLSSTQYAQILEEHGFCSAVTEGEQKRYGKRYKDYGKLRLMSIPMQKMIEFENDHDI